jgi:hypothetical protein
MSVTTASETDRGAPPPSPPPSSPTCRPRRWLIVAAVLIAAAGAVIVTVVIVTHRHRRHAAAPSPTIAAATSGPAQQRRLVDAAQVVNRMTLHATYRALGDPAKLGGPLRYEVWQRPPDGREDRNGATASRCHQDGKGAWTCRAASGAVEPAGTVPGPLELLAAVSNFASTPSARETITTSSDIIGNDKVTCYQVAAPGETYVLCAAANGTPELIANTTVRYELVTATSSVPASAVTP